MNRLIKFTFLILFWVFNHSIHAQESDEYSKISFSIRAKYLYLPGWENVSWRSYSYGGEIFIGKHHAVGIDGDGYQIHWRNEEGSTDVLIAMEITKKTSIYLDYKYIQPFNEQFSLYGQLYSRLYGKRNERIEKSDDYQFEDPESENYLKETTKGTFTDIGLGVGGKWYFNGGSSGLDFNINMYRRFGSFVETNYSKTVGWTTNRVDESSKVFCYIRLAFFYHFLRFKRSNNPTD